VIVARPVTRTIARALGLIVLLSVVTTGLALVTLSRSLSDAEAVNVAGSLRMQIYRLAWDDARDAQRLARHFQLYQQTLQSPALTQLERPWVPNEVVSRYRYLRDSWPDLQQTLQPESGRVYQQSIASYVGEIDRFVLALQRYAELKMHLVAGSSLFGVLAIVALALWTLRFIRRRVVLPLNDLMTASHYVEQGNFVFPPLCSAQPNELGVLAEAFTTMAARLHEHYQLLESTVRHKTEALTEANRTLTLLYESSQILTSSTLEPELFQAVLDKVLAREALSALTLEVNDVAFHTGSHDASRAWQRVEVAQMNQLRGAMRWQTSGHSPDLALMQSLANMLARSLWIWQTQKQYHQMLLTEERATIARELHDSLAQALAFMRIQLTLLRRQITDTAPQTLAIITEFDRALTEAHQQLRELLTTFRLTINHADLNLAMQAMIAPLQTQTPAEIHFHTYPGLPALDAQQQVHVLQIAREALLNALRHAQARHIHVRFQPQDNGQCDLTIEDDGCGMPAHDAVPGHFGLAIMKERAARLAGTLTVTSQPTGTCVTLLFPSRETGPIAPP